MSDLTRCLPIWLRRILDAGQDRSCRGYGYLVGLVCKVGGVSDLVAAFPRALRADAATVVEAMPRTRLRAAQPFGVQVDGETVVIPYRVYNEQPQPSVFAMLSPRQKSMLACLYTRHHDGHVRQRYLRQVGELACGWVAPFVVQAAHY